MSPQQMTSASPVSRAEGPTIGRKIRLHSQTLPNHAAFMVSGSSCLSYRELRKEIDRAQADLHAAGFGPTARIVIALPTGPHAALAVVAIACCSVAVPLDPNLTLDEIDKRLAVLQPDAMLLLRGADSPARRAAKRRRLAIIEGIPSTVGTLGLRMVAPRQNGVAPGREPEGDAPAFILQTSGTTAEPMLIPFRHRNMLAAAARLAAWFELTPRDRCLSVSPVYYSHGLKVTIFTPLLTGGTIVFPTDPRKLDFEEWFGTLSPTWYSAGPTLHRLVFDRTRSNVQARTKHSLRFILSGGAPLPCDVREGLESAFGVPVVEHYGSSEAAQISANLPAPGLSKPGTCGIPWPDTVMIAGENGDPLPAGRQGEILVRGETVTSGYLDAPELNRASFVDDWFKTGDIGSVDNDGFLTLHGRRKEVINRGGEKVWPIEIDTALMTHPSVREAAAFAVPHSRLGEDVAAAVELRAGTTASPIELRTYLRERLASHKVPRRIMIVDELPRGLTGKVLRRRLSETFGAASASPAVTPGVRENSELSSQLIEVWERLLNVASVSIDDDFFERGGDSLLAAELLGEIERLIGRRIPSTILFEAATIRHIVQKLSAEESLQPKPLFQMPANSAQKPLIYFHGDPVGGSYVKRLADLIGSDQSLFVVAPHGLDDEPVPRSIEAMASDRLRAIVDAQPAGPYRLCGYCIGGLVAFETARLLKAAGQEVELVVMIDPPTTNARPSVQMILSVLSRVRPCGGRMMERAAAWTWYLMVAIDSKLGRFLELAPSQRVVRARTKIASVFSFFISRVVRVLPVRTQSSTDETRTTGFKAVPFGHLPFSYFFWRHSVAMSRYRPKPLSVRVVYFSADYSGEPWRRISPDLEVIKLAGGHYGVPLDPSDFANHLRTRLQEQIA